MATTTQWLDNQRWADLAFVLEFEGLDLVCHTAGKGSISTAWAATDWTVFKAGLQIVGSIEDSIKPFCGDIDPGSLTFNIVDTDGTVISAIFGTASGTKRHLAADIDCDDTRITLGTGLTNPFVEDQICYIGLEAVKCDAPDGDAEWIDLKTRGWCTSLETSTGRRGQAHRIDTATTFAPSISSTPTTHFNRIVSLWVTHWENGAWATRANARRLWSGRIKSWGEEGDGRVAIQATDIREMLGKTLLADQLRGTLSDGVYIGDVNTAAMISVTQTSTGVITYSNATTLSSLVGSYCTHTDIASAIQTLIDTWNTGISGESITGTLALEMNADGHYQLVFTGSASNTYTLTIGFSVTVWQQLGLFGTGMVPAQDEDGRTLRLLTMVYGYTDGQLFYSQRQPPPQFAGAVEVDDVFGLASSSGTWHDQPGITTGGDGFLLVGKTLIEVTEAAGQFTVVRIVEGDGVNWEDSPEVKQVWYSTKPVGLSMYEVAVSTGTADHNVTTYDCLPVSMGCGIPHAALDRASWLELGLSSDDGFRLVVEEPRAFKDILESALSVRNAHLVMRAGQMVINRGIGATSVAESVATLDASNTAQSVRGGAGAGPQRTSASYGTDGVINRVTLRYNRTLGTKDYPAQVIINHLLSQTDAGQTRGVVIEADGFYAAGTEDPVVQSWIEDVAANALAYCASPWATITRTFDLSLLTSLYPGATCALTDSTLVSPSAGTRGVSSLTVWVMSVAFDWSTGVGTVKLLLSPNAPTIRSWAPSAMVDHAAANGGWDAENWVLSLLAHQYSASTQTKDALQIAPNDAIHVVESSPANPAAPQEWYTQAEVVGEDWILLTSDLSGWDPTKYYVVERDDSGSVSAANLAASTYIEVDGHAWGPVAQPITDAGATALTYTDLYRKPASSMDVATEPLSVHKLCDVARWMATAWDHHTSPVLVNEAWATALQATGDSVQTLLYGPIRLPYLLPDRQWVVSVLAYMDPVCVGTGTITVTSSASPPTGPTTSALTFSGETVSATATVTSTTADWVDSSPFYPVETYDFGRGASLYFDKDALTWITIRGITDGANSIINVLAICVREVPL